MEPLQKIAKIEVEMDSPENVANFLSYISELIRRNKKVTIFVQVED